MVRYNLLVLKVLLNPSKQTNAKWYTLNQLQGWYKMRKLNKHSEAVLRLVNHD